MPEEIENYNEAFIGIWAEFHSSESIQVFRGENEDIYFESEDDKEEYIIGIIFKIIYLYI